MSRRTRAGGFCQTFPEYCERTFSLLIPDSRCGERRAPPCVVSHLCRFVVVCEMMRMYPLLFGAGAVRKCHAFSTAGFVSSHPPPPQPPPPTLSSQIGFSFTPGVYQLLFRLFGLRSRSVSSHVSLLTVNTSTHPFERVAISNGRSFFDGHWYCLPTKFQLRNSKVSHMYYVPQQLKLLHRPQFPCACLLRGLLRSTGVV